MDKNSIRSTIISFEIAIIKELYKNKKIGEEQFTKVIKKLESELEKIIIANNLVPSVIDIKV